MTDRVPYDRLGELARSSGTFAMVAMDQRESLRAMFAERVTGDVPIETRIAFKVAVARLLSPHASAMLLDAEEALGPILDAGALDPGCGLIIAADALVQPIGGPVDDTDLDEAVDLIAAAERGAVAAKLLVIWKEDRSADARADVVGRFLERSRAAGLPGIVEGVVRPPAGVEDADWTEREDALLEATAELGALRPDLYKAQVPLGGRGDPDEMVRRSRRMTDALPCPWVVLSAGVALEDFATGVEAACRGGASGFLAGRAVWRDAIGPDPEPALLQRSVPRLRHLGEIVDAHARPWTESPRPV